MSDKKRKTPFSATQYSMAWLRKNGYSVDKTEQTVRWPNPAFPGTFKIVKKDLFGFCDIAAVKSGEPGTTYVQTTSDEGGGHSGARVEKIAGIPVAYIILRAGNRIHVHGWSKRGPRGKPKFWKLKRIEITLDSEGMMQTKILPGTEEQEEEQTGQKPMEFEQEDF